MSNEAWKAFCDFATSQAKSRFPDEEPWDVVMAPAAKAKPKLKRKRKPTIAAAMRQAAKAGVTPVAATIKPDGSVSLQFGCADGDSSSIEARHENEWDEVLQ